MPLLRRKSFRLCIGIVCRPRRKLHSQFHSASICILKQYLVFIETRATKANLWSLRQALFEPLRAYINKFREIKPKISYLNEGVALAALKNGVWFSFKFKEEMLVRAPYWLDDALHRASYFASHEKEVAALKEEYNANKKTQQQKDSRNQRNSNSWTAFLCNK